MMKTFKNQKGITLVALVSTIIILLILSGVAIGFAVNGNGVFDKAKQATEEYNNKAIEEQTSLNTLFGMVEKYTNGGGNTTPPAPTYTAYTIGDTVTVNGESFYVLENSDTSQAEVTLLAKYNLNQAGTAQAPNAEYDEDTACVFSSTNYWVTAYAAYTDWSTKKLDINIVRGEVAGDAIYKAKQYAKTITGDNTNNTGRLLTYEEADALKTSYSDMIWGKANRQGEGSSYYYLDFWLSSAAEYDGCVWYVDGSEKEFLYRNFGGHQGVRPVITVSKSLIS